MAGSEEKKLEWWDPDAISEGFSRAIQAEVTYLHTKGYILHSGDREGRVIGLPPPVSEEVLRRVTADDLEVFAAALAMLHEHVAQGDCGSFAQPPSEGVLRARVAAASSVLPEDRFNLKVELAVQKYYELRPEK